MLRACTPSRAVGWVWAENFAVPSRSAVPGVNCQAGGGLGEGREGLRHQIDRVGQDDPCRVQLRIIHEEPADRIEPVADPGGPHLVGNEKEARILDPAHGEHVEPRLEREPLSVETGRMQARDGAGVGVGVVGGFDVDDIGEQVGVQGNRISELSEE